MPPFSEACWGLGQLLWFPWFCCGDWLGEVKISAAATRESQKE